MHRGILDIELRKRIAKRLKEDETYSDSPEYAEVLLRYMLKEWSFNPYLIGFEHLVQSVIMCYVDPEMLKYKTKVLFPVIAKLNRSAACNIRRNIRTLVLDIWARPEKAVFCRCTDCKELIERKEPSCSEMIDILEKYLRKEVVEYASRWDNN